MYLGVDTPSIDQNSTKSSKKFPHYPDIYACAKSTEGEIGVSFRIIVLAVEVESK